MTTAEVVGLDPACDSALLRTKSRLPGTLRLLDGLPAWAEELGALGFPLETYELRFSKGMVSGLH